MLKTQSKKKQTAPVWIVAPFSSEHESDRYKYIAKTLHSKGFIITQFVSSFDHHQKKFRTPISKEWRVVPIFELGYTSNVSIRRVVSHIIFDICSVICFLLEIIKHRKPKVVIAAVPHSGAALGLCLLSWIFQFKVYVDIHDTWPESFSSVYEKGLFSAPIFALWKLFAALPLVLADEVFAESKSYAEKASATRIKFDKSAAVPVYLGGDLSRYYEQINRPAGLDSILTSKFIVAYAGNLGRNYDLFNLLEAFAIFTAKFPDSCLLFIGGGELEEELKRLSRRKNLRTHFTGRVSHSELVGALKLADLGVNCFKPSGNVAYSYKFNDYVLSGLPVINSLEGETKELVDDWCIGFNYTAGSVQSLAAALITAHQKLEQDSEWSDNVLKFSRAMLEREEIYRPFFEKVSAAFK